MDRKKIMVICDYFLPGFKGGGGTRSMINLVDRFCDRYDFYVVTRNHDGRSDRVPYSDVKSGEWNKNIGSADVFYLPQNKVNKKTVKRLFEDVRPDLVFLNSVFSTPCISFLRARSGVGIPVIIAPCGELAPASLALKSFKKRAFLLAARLLGLHRNVIWKATTQAEVAEITNVIGASARIQVAADLPPKTILPNLDPATKPLKRAGSVHFAFVARIVRVKNLHFFLERLKWIEGEIVLDIIGPIDDIEYWLECKELISRLPRNIKVNSLGPMSNQKVLEHLVGAHFFVLPSLSENFGYVFIEALAAGLPLLISDRTIWSHVGDAGAGWAIPLENNAEWENRIRECVEMEQEQYRERSVSARSFAERWLADPQTEQDTELVLENAIRQT